MFTEKILRGRGLEVARSLNSKNAFYFPLPFGVSFDFLIANFVRRYPNAQNDIVCGDSTKAIPLYGCSYRANFQ